ncbi:MAG: translation initiation factor IF-2 subunit gamma [archaeon]
MNEPKQAEVNIGLAGHVDHGKTSIVKGLSGKWTDTHSEELKRGITMKLGYADTTFYKCKDKEGNEKYTVKPDECEGEPEVVRKISFIDCPGHETLMTVTLSGANIMDGALLIIAANEECPQPQTKEHLAALDITDTKNIVIAQTKIDLVDKKQAEKHKKQIEELIKGTVAENAPIIPIAAHHNINYDKLIQAIEEEIPTPKRDPNKPGRLRIARSFDINKPGSPIKDMKGGIIGGSLTQGKLKVGDEIEIVPGIREDGETKKLETEITSLSTEKHEIKEANPGGLIGVQTKLDPSLTKGDNLIGSIVSKKGTSPQVKKEIEIKPTLLEENVGIEEIEPLKTNENLVITVGTDTVLGTVEKIFKDTVKIKLRKEIPIEKNARIAISRKIKARWRLIGYGEIVEK